MLLDANAADNENVSQAQDQLVADLLGRNCDVFVLTLPQIEGVNGPDDLLALPNGAVVKPNAKPPRLGRCSRLSASSRRRLSLSLTCASRHFFISEHQNLVMLLAGGFGYFLSVSL